MKIKDRVKLVQISEELDRLLEKSQEAIELEENEGRGEYDIYNMIQDVMNAIDDMIGEKSKG